MRQLPQRKNWETELRQRAKEKQLMKELDPMGPWAYHAIGCAGDTTTLEMLLGERPARVRFEVLFKYYGFVL